MEIIHKIVNFEKYCETCKHKDLKETLDPCQECLEHPVNTHTEVPVRYKKDDNKKEKK